MYNECTWNIRNRILTIKDVRRIKLNCINEYGMDDHGIKIELIDVQLKLSEL